MSLLPPLTPEPPQFSGSGLPNYPVPSSSELSEEPDFPPTEPRVYTFDLKSKKGEPWAILQVRANGYLSKQLPAYIEGEEINGNVTLKLETPDNIQTITVAVSFCLLALRAHLAEWCTGSRSSCYWNRP
jgi:hypothetical protein